MGNNEKVAISWSGGKDCCLSLYRALKQGYQVSHMVNFISQEYRRVRFHGTEAALIQLQSQALGIPLLQKETGNDDYEKCFKEAVRSLLSQGITGMVFGDIYLDDHREWVERVCQEIGIHAVEPLWGDAPVKLVTEFINSGFKAVVVSAHSAIVERRWVGHPVDIAFIDYLVANDIDACGENGEFHTFVIDGPIFKQRIDIRESRPLERSGFWLADLAKYELITKESGLKLLKKPLSARI